jgi:hypothetical protein
MNIKVKNIFMKFSQDLKKEEDFTLFELVGYHHDLKKKQSQILKFHTIVNTGIASFLIASFFTRNVANRDISNSVWHIFVSNLSVLLGFNLTSFLLNIYLKNKTKSTRKYLLSIVKSHLNRCDILVVCLNQNLKNNDDVQHKKILDAFSTSFEQLEKNVLDGNNCFVECINMIHYIRKAITENYMRFF